MMLQALFSLTFLTVASAFDLKARAVPNRLWMFFLPASMVILSVRLLLSPDQLVISLISIAITTAIAIAIFYLGLYGGADAKALITLAIAHPISTNLFLHFPFLPLSTFNNSLMLMILTVPFVPVQNFYWKMMRRKSLFQGLEKEPNWKKVAALLFCIKTETSKIKPYHILAEKRIYLNGEAQRTLKIFQKVPEEDVKIDNTLPDDVFVVFSLPMLPFLTIAYILSIVSGDLILHLLTILLS